MKIVIISNSDIQGGAARASFRLMSGLNCHRANCTMIVKNKQSKSGHVIEQKSKWIKLRDFFFHKLSTALVKLQRTSSHTQHSLNIFGSSVFKLIRKSEADVVNIHWINFETLSIRQIGCINKPVVLTLHDMWAFCGSEHLAKDVKDAAFRVGYESGYCDYVSGINFNKYIWKIKKKFWNTPFHIVTPSQWMANCAKESALFHGWDISVIPNCLDVDIFKPMSKKFSRELFNLPIDKFLIGFGAFGGVSDLNKGFDLLDKALQYIEDKDKDKYRCVVFGQSEKKGLPTLPIKVIYLGHLADDVTLSAMYNAIDVMVVPSRQESFSQTASEATACGTPVTAFKTSGLCDVVEHLKTGYLARPFDTYDLSNGIVWCIENNRSGRLGEHARERASKLWAYETVVNQYNQLYERVVAESRVNRNA